MTNQSSQILEMTAITAGRSYTLSFTLTGRAQGPRSFTFTDWAVRKQTQESRRSLSGSSTDRAPEVADVNL